MYDWDLGVCLLYECRRKQLRKPDLLNSWIDLRLRGSAHPLHECDLITSNVPFQLFYNRRPKGLNGALQDVSIEFSGREHSGLDDSWNTARLAWRMICDGCVMKITKSLDKAPPNSSVRPGPSSAVQAHKSREGDVNQATAIAKEDEQDLKKGRNTEKPNDQLLAGANQDCAKNLKDGPSHKTLINGLSTTLGNDNKYRFPARTSLGPVKYGSRIGAFSSTPLDHSPHGRGHIIMSTTVHTVNDVSDLDVDPCSESDLSILADWEEAAVIEDSQHEGPGNVEEPDLIPVDSPSYAVLMLRNGHENPNRCQSRHSIGAAVVYRSPDTTIYNVHMKKPASNASGFTQELPSSKLPSALGNRLSGPSPSTGKTSKMSTLLDYFPKRKLASVSFYFPPKKLPFTIHEDGNRTLPVSRVLSNKVLSSTVNLNKTIGATKCDRITAPMCQCGRRAKKLTVSNIGPNHGRVFYSCSVQRRSDENSKGCNYFKWEDTLLKEKTPHTSAFLSTSAISASSNRSMTSVGSSAVHKPFIKLRPSMRT
ncbi:LOW QUALITY PROTEIN: ERI1 exoribonuclease 2-like [Anomaloglossus baeobatrachus]